MPVPSSFDPNSYNVSAHSISSFYPKVRYFDESGTIAEYLGDPISIPLGENNIDSHALGWGAVYVSSGDASTVLLPLIQEAFDSFVEGDGGDYLVLGNGFNLAKSRVYSIELVTLPMEFDPGTSSYIPA